jgi:hypothetical protein
MTLQSNGAISISQICTEKGVSFSNASLTTLSTTDINTASALKPDQAAPHAMSEFYGYNHNASGASGDCYQVYASGSSTTVYWTDGNGVSRSGNLSAMQSVYLCSQIFPYEGFTADLIVTPCYSSCSQVHTSITEAENNPCVC